MTTSDGLDPKQIAMGRLYEAMLMGHNLFFVRHYKYSQNEWTDDHRNKHELWARHRDINPYRVCCLAFPHNPYFPHGGKRPILHWYTAEYNGYSPKKAADLIDRYFWKLPD